VDELCGRPRLRVRSAPRGRIRRSAWSWWVHAQVPIPWLGAAQSAVQQHVHVGTATARLHQASSAAIRGAPHAPTLAGHDHVGVSRAAPPCIIIACAMSILVDGPRADAVAVTREKGKEGGKQASAILSTCRHAVAWPVPRRARRGCRDCLRDGASTTLSSQSWWRARAP